VSAAPPQQHRTIYDTHHSETLPGTVVRTEGQEPTSDVAVNEAYDGLGATFEFYLSVYDRNSIDDAGLHLDATVHYMSQYDNAFWNGEQMVFGDGDGDLFNRFTIAIDVIGHELTHGVTGSEANLTYLGQSGALNESISDVFGSLVKQYSLKQTAAQADWLIGQGLFTAKVRGVALRSMKAPGTAYDDPVLGKDPQPATMSGFVHTSRDNGGVHTNSGIPNHAFYLVATAIGGNAWEKAGRIWYETVRDPHLKPNANFTQFARLTAVNAARFFTATEKQAVIDAWHEVGVDAS
jgi:Zn-dependent metalloprotease